MKGLAIVYQSRTTANIFKNLFAEKGVEIDIMSTQELYKGITKEKIKLPLSQTWDFVLLYCHKKYDSKGIFDLLANDGIRVFNTPSAVEKCGDKWLTYKALQEANIPQMPTYENYNDAKENGLLETDENGNKLLKKIVVKELYGSFGEQVYLSSYLSDLKRLLEDLKSKNARFLLQEFCETTQNRGARITCIGGKFVATYYKKSKDGDFRVNLHKGSIGIQWQPPKSFIDMAEKTAQAIGADYCGIDFMFGEFDTPIVCEVNSMAAFSAMEKINEMDIKGMYVDYIISKVMEGDLL